MNKKLLICDDSKFKGKYTERKITMNKSTSGGINANLRIPIELLKRIGITENNRVVTINLEGDKLIVEDLKKKINLVREDLVEVTQEEKEYLLRYKSKDTLFQYIKKGFIIYFRRIL